MSMLCGVPRTRFIETPHKCTLSELNAYVNGGNKMHQYLGGSKGVAEASFDGCGMRRRACRYPKCLTRNSAAAS